MSGLRRKTKVIISNHTNKNKRIKILCPAKRIVNSTFIPYYNYAVEQAIGWKDSPQGTQFQNTIKEKASTLLGYVYPLSPLETSADFQINKDMSPSDNKKE